MEKANVLLIEDSAPDVMLLKIALDGAGFDYSLTSVQDGAEAVEYVREHDSRADSEAPDIVLLDLNIPKVDGVEILHQIRATKRFAEVPVLVLSSSQSPRDLSAVLSVSRTSFLVKPSHLDGFMDLGRAIKGFLGVK